MWQQLKSKYNQALVYEKLMFLNIGIFAVISIITAFFYLFTESHINYLSNNLVLPANLKELLFKPWTIITFFYSHFDFWHLLSNMIGLYFFGRIFITFFNARLFLNYYILGGLFSGLIFVLSYNLFPALISKNSSLVGASGAVFSILFGVTAKAPSYIFNFSLTGNKVYNGKVLQVSSTNPLPSSSIPLFGISLGFVHSKSFTA